jgi:hypothetical protein
MIDLRKLAVLQLAVSGPLIACTEFACGTFIPIGLGIFLLLHTFGGWQIALGVYFLCVGLNHVPMLWWVTSVGDRTAAWAELGPPWEYRGRVMRRYRLQSRVLYIPVVPLVLAILPKSRPGPKSDPPVDKWP